MDDGLPTPSIFSSSTTSSMTANRAGIRRRSHGLDPNAFIAIASQAPDEIPSWFHHKGGSEVFERMDVISAQVRRCPSRIARSSGVVRRPLDTADISLPSPNRQLD